MARVPQCLYRKYSASLRQRDSHIPHTPNKTRAWIFTGQLTQIHRPGKENVEGVKGKVLQYRPMHIPGYLWDSIPLPVNVEPKRKASTMRNRLLLHPV